jgi:hypothetical protein
MLMQQGARDLFNGEDNRLPGSATHLPTPTGSAREKVRNEESAQTIPESIAAARAPGLHQSSTRLRSR